MQAIYLFLLFLADFGQLVAGAPKIRGGTGGPGRFFAVIAASK